MSGQLLSLLGLKPDVKHTNSARDHTVLQGKQVFRLGRDRVCPQLFGSARIDQAQVDAHVVSSVLPARLEYQVGSKFRACPLDGVNLALADLTLRRNLEGRQPRQLGGYGF